MNLIPFTIAWGALALSVLLLLVCRKVVANKEDDNLHVLDGAAVQQSAAQAAVANKLEVIDKWGKILTLVALVSGLILGGFYVWQSWVAHTAIGV